MLDIKSIAIIGAGPSGLASLYEFLHTSKDGVSYYGGNEPDEKAFEKIVLFEQNSDVGGVWKLSDHDFSMPDSSILETEEYDKAEVLQPYNKDLNVDLSKTNPKKRLRASVNKPPSFGSALYDPLFTNLPQRFTRFSSLKFEELSDEPLIKPFIRAKDMNNHIEVFTENNSLRKYIRFNTTVYQVRKAGNKWRLVLQFYDRIDDNHEYYIEEFDALVVANGHYSVPYIPRIEGLPEYLRKYPSSITHGKSFRTPEDYNNKKVIVLGSSTSGIAITQYIYPVAKEFILSRRKREERFPWVNRVLDSRKIVIKPPIIRFLPQTKEIEFEDGSKIKDFDKIILASGYHYHYPFFEDNFLSLSIPEKKKAPANNSTIRGLYYNIFNIDDPTLAFVGIIHTFQLFSGFETQAAAIAGVWSNHSSLPSKQDQYTWESTKVKVTSDTSLFHSFSNESFKENYVDELKSLFASNRKYPLEDDLQHLSEFKVGEAALEEIFFRYLNREIIYENGRYKTAN